MILAINGRHLSDYLRHTTKSEAIRRLAKETGEHPSTMCRRVARIEALRDCEEWDSIIEATLEHWADCPQEITRDMVLDALGVNLKVLRLELRRVASHLIAPDGMIVAAQKLDRVLVTSPGTEPDSLDRSVLLGAVALGMVTQVDAGGSSGLRKYRATQEIRGAQAATLGNGLIELVRMSGTRGFAPLSGPERIKTAASIELLFATDSPRGLSDNMPERLFEVLKAGVEGSGFEAMEKRFGWSSRSAKVVMAIALDAADDYLVGVGS